MIGYYDLILGLIPLTLLGGVGTLHGIGLQLSIAVALASLIAVVLVGHALFVNSPVTPPRDSPVAAPVD